MLYTDFEKTLESRLRTKADLYPHAAEYHRVRLEQTIHHLLRSILEQTDTLVNMSRGLHSRNDSIRPGDGVPNTVWESNLAGTEAPAERRKTDIKSNLRDKFRDFLQSEEGRVGAKAPLAVGIAGGSLLLAQAMLPTDAQAHITCKGDNDCDAGEVCVMWQELEWSPGLGDWIWVKHSECINQVVLGFQDSGVDVLDLGRISTDMLYFAVVHYQTDGGIVITASHNPAAYNGMKLVGQHAVPISEDTGLFGVRDVVGRGASFEKQNGHCQGSLRSMRFLDAYLSHLRSFVDLSRFAGKRIVTNANSGLAGQIADRLLVDTPIQVCQRLFTEPDGSFAEIPGGRPDPLRPENRELTTAAVRQTGADLAVAWDTDADRCFFLDETGAFVEGCYITALLAEKVLQQRGRGGIIYDPRAIWAVEHAVFSGRGIPMLSRCGHAFIKAGMQESKAIFAGEASGHYYFRNNFYADNGMIPFLLMLEYLSVNGISLAEAVNPLRAAYPVSGMTQLNLFVNVGEPNHGK